MLNPAELAGRIVSGDLRALARGISMVENELAGFEELLHAVDSHIGRARRIGITGPPGAGKSMLTAAITKLYLSQGLRVGIVAVDPTSAFTGGALLGDRIRMNALSTVDQVFIRSMASRGSWGGLSAATREAADLLDAAGYDRVILETLGVGQAELDVAVSADSTVVVLVPEAGDGIQAMKSGLMEIADLYVVNKSDRPGADRLKNELGAMLAIRDATGRRTERGEPPPIVMTVATKGTGVDELVSQLDDHFDWLGDSGELAVRRRNQRIRRARDNLRARFRRDADRLWRLAPATLRDDGDSPYSIARQLYETGRRGDS